MKEDAVKKLLKKYLDGKASPAEQELVEDWLTYRTKGDRRFWQDKSEKVVLQTRMKQRFLKSLSDGKKPRYLRFRSANLVAASILLAFTFIFLYLFLQKKDSAIERNLANKRGVVLTLPDGSSIALDTKEQGQVKSNHGDLIAEKLHAEHLVFQKNSPIADRKEAVLQWNTLRVPKASTYSVSLPDGTLVYLNAESTIRFPRVFSATQRIVELTGEAYFEVVNDGNAPFLVESKNTRIEVLGTKFNMSAYEGEDVITTLVSGSVKVDNGHETLLLRPNQQALVRARASAIELKEVDTETILAWKNNYFIFDDISIQEIMRQVARWYDVEVTFLAGVSSPKIGGTFSRSKSIEDLLGKLAKLANVRFKIEKINAKNERRVTVMP